MIVYHGSYAEISAPDIKHSRTNLDFGRGLYVTDINEQAEKWCQKFIRSGQSGVVSEYELNNSAMEKCRVLKFDTYSEDWLDFISNCRNGTDNFDYDIIIGGVADDNVFNTCELYMKKYIDKNTALDRLRYEKPNNQICLKNQPTIDDYLQFRRSENCESRP